MISQSSLLNRRLAAEAILREAGHIALARFQARAFTVETKGTQDFVSEVDRETEAFIRQRLAELFPEDGFLGEESGGGSHAQALWVVDPIDGTSNFVRGNPFWCLSAGFIVDDTPAVGVIYDPCREELFGAHLGGGAWLNGAPIQVSETTEPAQAVLSIGFSLRTPLDRHQSVLGNLLAANGAYRMHGAGALALAQVAAGRADGFWEGFINSWDVAAGLVLVSEAGGYVSDFLDNNGLFDGNSILACTPHLTSFFAELTGGCWQTNSNSSPHG
jgi:myo-inositol-1(or 4)-monophosphatase